MFFNSIYQYNNNNLLHLSKTSPLFGFIKDTKYSSFDYKQTGANKLVSTHSVQDLASHLLHSG